MRDTWRDKQAGGKTFRKSRTFRESGREAGRQANQRISQTNK